jgi:hypothetical protein
MSCLLLKRHLTSLVALLMFMPTVGMTEENGFNDFDVDFSGHWELDYQLSDHPSEKIRRVYQEVRSNLEREMQRRGAYVDPSALNLSSIVGLGRLAERIAQATVLDIEQTANRIIVNRNDDFALVCDLRFMQAQRSVLGAEACYWEEDQLVFQIALPDGLQVRHRLSVARDRSRINVATTLVLRGVRYPFTLNRVYMPYEPGEGLFNCEYTIARQTTCTLGSGVVEPE